MNLNRKTLPAVTVAVAVLAVIGAISGIPSWALVTLLLLLLALIAATLRTAGSGAGVVAIGVHAESDALVEASAAVVEEQRPPASRAVYDIPLPSAVDDYQFSFSATVCWNPVGTSPHHVDLGGAAINAILLRAQRELATAEPTEQELALHRLTSVLARPEADTSQQVRAWAERVQLRLPDHYVESARIRGDFRRRTQIERLKREAERDFREYLKADALATPGSATVWWLARHPEDMERCVDLYPTLRRLSDVANDRMEIVGEQVWPLPADHEQEPTVPVALAEEEGPSGTEPFDLWAAVETFLDGHDDDQRRLKASQLAKLEDKFSRHDRAREIRQQFAPGSLAAGPDPQTPDVVAPSAVKATGDELSDPQAVDSLATTWPLVSTANGRTTPSSADDAPAALESPQSQDSTAASTEPSPQPAESVEPPPLAEIPPEEPVGGEERSRDADAAVSYREEFYSPSRSGGALSEPTDADESPAEDLSVDGVAHRRQEG